MNKTDIEIALFHLVLECWIWSKDIDDDSNGD